MSRHASAAQTRAESPAPIMAAFMGICPGSYQRAEESAPATPAAIVNSVCTGES